jgi:hypothetical protein
MRRYSVGLGDTQLEWPGVLLSLRNFPSAATDVRDTVFMTYWIVETTDSIRGPSTVDYAATQGEVFRNAAFKLNDASGQPLSLSLIDNARSDLPSWVPDWTRQRVRFLLNHAASKFLASPYAMCEVAYRHQKDHRRPPQPPDAEIAFSGLVVDVVQHRSSFLPPRRHCDHYAVNGANSYFLSEWHEFAREHSPATRSAHLVWLAYADTI